MQEEWSINVLALVLTAFSLEDSKVELEGKEFIQHLSTKKDTYILLKFQ